MSRKNILRIIVDILKLLKKGEYSIKAISYKVDSRWETTLKALEFLKEIGLVKERKGNVAYRAERLFSLVKS